MDLASIPAQQPDFHSEILDQEMILYFPGGGRYLYLNQTAALVWERCDGSQSAAQMIAALQQLFPESAAEISADVESALETLLQHGCIRLA